MTPWDSCAGFWPCVYDFQNLLSGILALGAAVLGAWALVKTARAPMEAERQYRREIDRRRLHAGSLELASEFARIAGLARQAQATIKVTIAERKDVTDTTRAKTILPVPTLLSEWDFMSLLQDDSARTAHDVRLRIEAHNFDMCRAGGSFGDDNFGKRVQEQAHEVALTCSQLAHVFTAEANRARSKAERP